MDPDTVISEIHRSETFRLKVISALQNTPAQFQTFSMNQSPLKNDRSNPETVGSIPLHADVVTKTELIHLIREINDTSKTELLESN